MKIFTYMSGGVLETRYTADGVIDRTNMIDNFTSQNSELRTDPFYIYTLSDTTGVRYVGQTNNPRTRLSHHLCQVRGGRDKTERGYWIREVEFVWMKVIEKCTQQMVNERERHWVHFYHEQGCVLVNGIYKILGRQSRR